MGLSLTCSFQELATRSETSEQAGVFLVSVTKPRVGGWWWGGGLVGYRHTIFWQRASGGGLSQPFHHVTPMFMFAYSALRKISHKVGASEREARLEAPFRVCTWGRITPSLAHVTAARPQITQPRHMDSHNNKTGSVCPRQELGEVSTKETTPQKKGKYRGSQGGWQTVTLDLEGHRHTKGLEDIRRWGRLRLVGGRRGREDASATRYFNLPQNKSAWNFPAWFFRGHVTGSGGLQHLGPHPTAPRPRLRLETKQQLRQTRTCQHSDRKRVTPPFPPCCGLKTPSYSFQ